MFGTILIVIGSVMHLYVFWRLRSVPLVKRRVPLTVFIVAGVILWAGFVLGRVLGHSGTGTAAVALELFGMTWLVTMFLTFLCVLTMDLATFFGLLFRRYAPALRGWAVLAGLALATIALVQGLRAPAVSLYEVTLDGLPAALDGTKVAVLTDLHLGTLLDEDWLNARVAQVEALQPDLIVIVGDIFEGHGGTSGAIVKGLGRLHAPSGVWAVRGNHESFRPGDEAGALLAKAHIPLLDNRWVELRPGLILAGVEDLTSAGRRSTPGAELIAKTLADRPPTEATILLSHSPLETDAAARQGVDLMLSGHTHGGQVWPFGYLVQRRYPYLAGRYEVDGMTLIVCRGTGTWGPRMRLWRRGEILLVTLRSKS